MTSFRAFLVIPALLALPHLACSKEPTTQAEPVPATVGEKPATAGKAGEKQTQNLTTGALAQAESAAIGKPAPDFALQDLDGKTVTLRQFLGKKVVLEWFNPECPFVKKSHTVGSLKGLAEKHTKAGVVWLAINSGAAGKQGHGVETNRQGVQSFALGHPVLLDEDGRVGKAYGAQRTPHLFVIDEQGVLAYRGAIDNSPDAEGESPTGGTLVNYVDQALANLAGGKPVEAASTEAYGCSVKYANRL